MSIPADSQEATVNTFVTSTAVIKFSGGSVGTDEWTDSEEEEGLDSEKLPSQHTASPQRSSDALHVNHNSEVAKENALRNSTGPTGLTSKRDLISNGNAGVRHKHSRESADSRIVMSKSNGSRNETIQNKQCLDQQIGIAKAPFGKDSESSSLQWNDHERRSPLNSRSTPVEHTNDLDKHGWREEHYEEIMNPFAEVPRHQSGAGVLQSEDG